MEGGGAVKIQNHQANQVWVREEPLASSPDPWGLEATSCHSSHRNGLGPVKEGEAQYAVVHCTGYIKAWPPAGEQEPPTC